MEAVDFVHRRETENIPSQLSLWERNIVDADEPLWELIHIAPFKDPLLMSLFYSYQHVLSGAKQPEPTEAKGGIIADEMGLGKSLVILCTIARSLKRAGEFARTENQQTSSQPPRKSASKATLIIAPSSRMCSLEEVCVPYNNSVFSFDWQLGWRNLQVWTTSSQQAPSIFTNDRIRHVYPGELPCYKYLGPGRDKEPELLHDTAIVFTTYATAAAEFRRGNSNLERIKWFRIVLDEGKSRKMMLNPSFNTFDSPWNSESDHQAIPGSC